MEWFRYAIEFVYASHLVPCCAPIDMVDTIIRYVYLDIQNGGRVLDLNAAFGGALATLIRFGYARNVTGLCRSKLEYESCRARLLSVLNITQGVCVSSDCFAACVEDSVVELEMAGIQVRNREYLFDLVLSVAPVHYLTTEEWELLLNGMFWEPFLTNPEIHPSLLLGVLGVTQLSASGTLILLVPRVQVFQKSSLNCFAFIFERSRLAAVHDIPKENFNPPLCGQYSESVVLVFQAVECVTNPFKGIVSQKMLGDFLKVGPSASPQDNGAQKSQVKIQSSPSWDVAVIHEKLLSRLKDVFPTWSEYFSEEQMTSLAARLAPLSLEYEMEVVQEEGRGHCAFCGIARQLNQARGSKYDALQIRKHLISELRSHPERYTHSVSDLSAYIASHERALTEGVTQAYADEVALQALANCSELRIKLFIYLASGSFYEYVPQAPPQNNFLHVHLINWDDMHFDSVMLYPHARVPRSMQLNSSLLNDETHLMTRDVSESSAKEQELNIEQEKMQIDFVIRESKKIKLDPKQ